MTFFEKIERINRLHRLIKRENTGTPESLSKQLGMSRATLYNIIDELKLMDAPINYSRIKESFYYTKCFDLNICCEITILEDEVELKKITGGHIFFFQSSSVQFFRRKSLTFANKSFVDKLY